jgi:adenylate cyclase class 2
VVEQEMKIPGAALTVVREHLAQRGGRCLHPSALEDNWVLDGPDRTLSGSGRLLRVRQAGGRAWLTLKEPGSFSGGVKSRIEIETSIGSAETVLAILAGLGFRPARRYQKRRETWSWGPIVVALDETPMGAFVELEGPAERLAGAARDLGLDPETAVLGTYLDLWTAYRALHPDAPLDMVFLP